MVKDTGKVKNKKAICINNIAWKKATNIFQHRAIAGVMAAVFATLWVFAVELDLTNEIKWQKMTLLAIVLLAVVLFFAFSFVLTKLGEIKISRKKLKISRKKWWICFFVLLFFNILVFLAVFPGVFGYDSAYQVEQFWEGHSVHTHSSVLYSCILHLFTIFGWKTYAVFIFLQVIFMTYVETRVTVFSAKKINKKWMLFGAVGFFVINTFVKILISSSCQDVLFGGIYALIMIHLIELSSDPNTYLKTKKNYFILPLLIFLLMAMRNNGLYVVIIVSVISFIVLRRYWRRLMVLFLLPLVVFFVYTGPFFDIVGVGKSNDALKEMSSIPVQQITRAFWAHPEKFSDEDREELSKFFEESESMVEFYPAQPGISDDRKRRLKVDYLKDHLFDFAGFYFKTGAKSLGDYTEAAMFTNMGYYYPSKKYNDSRNYHPLIETEASISDDTQKNVMQNLGTSSKPILKTYNNFLISFAGSLKNRDEAIMWQYVDIIKVVLGPGTYFVLTAFAIALAVIKKNKKIVLPIGLIVGLYITLLLSPVVLFRYVFPIVLCAPLLLALIFQGDNQSHKNKK